MGQNRVEGGGWRVEGRLGVLDKECVGSENGTADVTFCPLHYRKEADTDEKLFTNPQMSRSKNVSAKVNKKHMEHYFLPSFILNLCLCASCSSEQCRESKRQA